MVQRMVFFSSAYQCPSRNPCFITVIYFYLHVFYDASPSWGRECPCEPSIFLHLWAREMIWPLKNRLKPQNTALEWVVVKTTTHCKAVFLLWGLFLVWYCSCIFIYSFIYLFIYLFIVWPGLMSYCCVWCVLSGTVITSLGEDVHCFDVRWFVACMLSIVMCLLLPLVSLLGFVLWLWHFLDIFLDYFGCYGNLKLSFG